MRKTDQFKSWFVRDVWSPSKKRTSIRRLTSHGAPTADKLPRSLRSVSPAPPCHHSNGRYFSRSWIAVFDAWSASPLKYPIPVSSKIQPFIAQFLPSPLASISGTRSTPSAFSTKPAKLWKSVPSPITASRSGGFHRSMEARLPVSFRVHGPGRWQQRLGAAAPNPAKLSQLDRIWISPLNPLRELFPSRPPWEAGGISFA